MNTSIENSVINRGTFVYIVGVFIPWPIVAYVIIMVILVKSIRSLSIPVEKYFLSFFTCCCLTLISKSLMLFLSAAIKEWRGDYCKVAGGFIIFLQYASVLHLWVFCFDRFFGVQRTQTYLSSMTPFRVGIYIAMSWFGAGVIIGLHFLVSFTIDYHDSIYQCDISFQFEERASIFLYVLFGPFSRIAVFLTIIFLLLTFSKRYRGLRHNNMICRNPVGLTSQLNATKVFCIISAFDLVMFGFGWLFRLISYMVPSLGKLAAGYIIANLVYLISLPFIFIIITRSIRNKIRFWKKIKLSSRSFRIFTTGPNDNPSARDYNYRSESIMKFFRNSPSLRESSAASERTSSNTSKPQNITLRCSLDIDDGVNARPSLGSVQSEKTTCSISLKTPGSPRISAQSNTTHPFRNSFSLSHSLNHTPDCQKYIYVNSGSEGACPIPERPRSAFEYPSVSTISDASPYNVSMHTNLSYQNSPQTDEGSSDSAPPNKILFDTWNIKPGQQGNVIEMTYRKSNSLEEKANSSKKARRASLIANKVSHFTSPKAGKRSKSVTVKMITNPLNLEMGRSKLKCKRLRKNTLLTNPDSSKLSRISDASAVSSCKSSTYSPLSVSQSTSSYHQFTENKVSIPGAVDSPEYKKLSTVTTTLQIDFNNDKMGGSATNVRATMRSPCPSYTHEQPSCAHSVDVVSVKSFAPEQTWNENAQGKLSSDSTSTSSSGNRRRKKVIIDPNSEVYLGTLSS